MLTLKRLDAGDYLENVYIIDRHYGTPFSELKRIKDAGKIPILEVEFQGSQKLVEKNVAANFLFIYPPSIEELRKRLANRPDETEEQFKRRIAAAINEMEIANKSVLFTNRIVNDDRAIAVEQFFTLVDALYFQELKEKRGEHYHEQ